MELGIPNKILVVGSFHPLRDTILNALMIRWRGTKVIPVISGDEALKLINDGNNEEKLMALVTEQTPCSGEKTSGIDLIKAARAKNPEIKCVLVVEEADSSWLKGLLADEGLTGMITVIGCYDYDILKKIPTAL